MEENKEMTMQEINQSIVSITEKLVLIELALKDLTRKVENIPILDDDTVKVSTSSIGIYDRLVNSEEDKIKEKTNENNR